MLVRRLWWGGLKSLFDLCFRVYDIFQIGKAWRAACLARIQRSLGACGHNLAIQLPVVLENPGSICIGNDVSLSGYTHFWGSGRITIGDRVMIGAHSSISASTHDYRTPSPRWTWVGKPVVIEDDVWIGSNCSILPGITIGKGAVVGAGAVVTKDIPPYAIVAGVPARIMANRSAYANHDSTTK